MSNDPRWHYPPPLTLELQLRYLMYGVFDAFDVATHVLSERVSQQGTSAVRYLAEAAALIHWLLEFDDDVERRSRAYSITMGQVIRHRILVNEQVKLSNADARAVAEEASRMRERLVEIAREDGIQDLEREPTKEQLFNGYMSPGYGLFRHRPRRVPEGRRTPHPGGHHGRNAKGPARPAVGAS
jgi:hypothetical protein